jgi:ATP-binding cassette subfamily C (CFTR/MRP) protein 1
VPVPLNSISLRCQKATVWNFLCQAISPTDKHTATPVGSAGISLSGGQKQRLALARAVYARKELVILDDVFSGLDAETEEQVFDRLFSANGLFHEMGTTILLVTHAVHRLPYSDHVICLDSLGRVSEQGSFDHLKASGGYVESLATKHKSESASEKSIEVTDKPKEIALIKAEIEEIDIETEELNRQTGDFAVYKYYFASIGWRNTSPYVASVILNGVSIKMTEFLLTYCK